MKLIKHIFTVFLVSPINIVINLMLFSSLGYVIGHIYFGDAMAWFNTGVTVALIFSVLEVMWIAVKPFCDYVADRVLPPTN